MTPEDRHAAAIAAGRLEAAKSLRRRAREAALAAGAEVPAWAAIGWRAPKPPATEREALTATIAEYVAQPIEVTAYDSVRAWARAGDRALTFHPDTGAVTLIAFCPRREAHFPSEAAALEAIAAGTVQWRTPRPRAVGRRRLVAA